MEGILIQETKIDWEGHKIFYEKALGHEINSSMVS